MDRVMQSTASLGDRMKGYERSMRTYVPSGSFAVLRLDGRRFSAWTSDLERPYDSGFIDAMAAVAGALVAEIGGAVLGYVQSDEISILLADGCESAEPWFGGEVQKIVSVSASLASASFARVYPDRPLAAFDARVSVLPSLVEVGNAFLWRWNDARRNAVSMLCHHALDPARVEGVPTAERRRLLSDVGVDVGAQDPRFLHGQYLLRRRSERRTRYVDGRTGEHRTSDPVIRREWETVPAISRPSSDPEGWLGAYLVEQGLS